VAAIDPDPTDVAALNAALVAERDRLAQIVDVLPVGIVLMDLSGRVTLENKATRELFQRDEAPAPGLTGPLRGTLTRADGSEYDLRDVPIARSLRGEEVRGELVRYTRADGRRYDLLTNSAPLRDAGGAIAGAIAAYEDVTALSDAERERTAFFAMASHELKTPVTAVRGQIQLALRFFQRGSADMVTGALERAVKTDAHGAVVTFLGTTRETSPDDPRPVAALEYEAYESMAVAEMEAIADALEKTHWCRKDAAKMLGDDKFEIRPMGRGFVKVGGAETDPEDIKMAEECWRAGREAIYGGTYDLVVLDLIAMGRWV